MNTMIKLPCRRVVVGNTCFYIFWLILLLGKGLGYTSKIPAMRMMTWCAIPFALLKLISTRWSRMELCIVIPLFMLGIINMLFTKETTALLTVITISCMKNIDMDTLFLRSFWIKLGLFIYTISKSLLGITDMEKIIRYEADEMTVRYALGYGQPNSTHYTLFCIIVFCVLSYKDALKFLHYLLLMLGNALLYGFTYSRTGFIMCTGVIIIGYLLKFKGTKMIWRWFVDIIGKNAFLILSLVSIVICYLINQIEWLSSFGTLSSRFITSAAVINDQNISLFGNYGVETDFGYINILYTDGAIFFLLFIMLNTVLLYRFNKMKMAHETLIMICYSVYSLSESYTDSILMNISLAYFSAILFKGNSRGI